MFTAVSFYSRLWQSCGSGGRRWRIRNKSLQFYWIFLCFAVCVMPLKPSEAKFCASCHFPSLVQLRPPSHEIRDMSVKPCENRLGNKHLSTWTIDDSLLIEQGILFYNTFGQEPPRVPNFTWQGKNIRTINKNHVALLFDATVRFRVTRQTVHPVCYLSERI